ncbi:hypothetical protein QBC39DRAFT_352788 [Podospora conica]|nr:hypothetical protein QBC39DRAFT_352788 [Schizothecium conicum]
MNPSFSTPKHSDSLNSTRRPSKALNKSTPSPTPQSKMAASSSSDSDLGFFRPLQIPDASPSFNPNSRRHHYLVANAAGFRLERSLNNTPNKVTVVIAHAVQVSPSSGEVTVVIKHCGCNYRYPDLEDTAQPMEIEISTLYDPLVSRQLPVSLHVFPELLSFRIHSDTPPEDYGAALIYKYYNGGTLSELIHQSQSRREAIPEYLIWHIIARLTRAYCFLHTGQPRYQPAVADPSWDPIVHNDGNASNIFLHYPTPAELSNDRSLASVCRNGLPQVILGDFGHAFSSSNDRGWAAQQRRTAYALELPTWMDKAHFGRLIAQLATAVLSPRPEGWDTQFDQESPVHRRPVVARYSAGLVAILDKFGPVLRWLNVTHDRANSPRTRVPSILAPMGFPSDEELFRQMMDMADARVEAFHASRRR